MLHQEAPRVSQHGQVQSNVLLTALKDRPAFTSDKLIDIDVALCQAGSVDASAALVTRAMLPVKEGHTGKR